MGALRIGFLSSLVLELLAMLGVAMVATAVGIQLAGGHMELVAGLTVLLLAPELYMPLRQLGAQFHASADGMAAAERIFEVIDQPAAVSFARLNGRARRLPIRLGVRGHRPASRSPGRVGSRSCDSIDLELQPGETVALVGPSGGGKSTLATLLLRLAEPDSGRISCGGVDLADGRTEGLAAPDRLGAPAADHLRRDPRREPEAVQPGGRRPEELAAAVESTSLDEVVASLPAGLETMVGEGGRRLSAGQTQRIALARALLSKAPLLILDEPTAHLDEETERTLAEAINLAAEGRTALIVSHRPEPIARADRTLALVKACLHRRAANAEAKADGMIAARLEQEPARPGGPRDPEPLEALRPFGPARHLHRPRRGRAVHRFRLPDQPGRRAPGDPLPDRGDRRRPLLRHLPGAAPLRRATDLA